MTRALALITVFLFAAIGVAPLPPVAHGREQGTPGQFDFYILSLSWSPSFCETAVGGARNRQCGPRPYSFVVHGLWPQYERGFPESCQVPPPRLSRAVMQSMLDLMPAPALIYHEWDQHGTCSGLQPREYFDLVRAARARVAIPAQFANPEVPLRVTPNEVVGAFVSANKDLTSADIIIDCDRMRLREVRICLSRDLGFRRCSRQRSCRADLLMMPPVRGR